MPIIQNKKNGKAVIKCIASETIPLANLAVGDEVVRGASICAVFWTGPWTVVRGANTVLQLTDGQDSWELEGDYAISQDESGSFVFTVGAPAGTIIIEVNKKSGDEP